MKKIEIGSHEINDNLQIKKISTCEIQCGIHEIQNGMSKKIICSIENFNDTCKMR